MRTLVACMKWWGELNRSHPRLPSPKQRGEAFLWPHAETVKGGMGIEVQEGKFLKDWPEKQKFIKL